MDLLKDCILDHIAIATDSIDKSVAQYELLGLKFSDDREVVESQNVTTAFASIDKNAHIELLEPLSSEGAIAKFISSKGPGIHHLCFKVPDVVAKQAELEAAGVKMIYPEPFAGANNCLVNFIHPKSMNGVLVEISQKMDGEV